MIQVQMRSNDFDTSSSDVSTLSSGDINNCAASMHRFFGVGRFVRSYFRESLMCVRSVCLCDLLRRSPGQTRDCSPRKGWIIVSETEVGTGVATPARFSQRWTSQPRRADVRHKQDRRIISQSKTAGLIQQWSSSRTNTRRVDSINTTASDQQN